MTWTKLSDDATDEMWSLSDAAFRLHIELLNYSNKKLLDGRIERDELRRCAKRPEALDELVAGGWVELDGDYIVVGFHQEWQPTRAQVLATAERNRQNGRKGGRPRKPTPPDGNPSGNPDGNPEGLVWSGTGQASTEGDHLRSAGAREEPIADERTGEVRGWAVAELGGADAPAGAVEPVGDARVFFDPSRPYAGERGAA